MEERASEQPYYNRGLFSEHYLLHRLPEHPVWQKDVHPAFSQALSLYQQKKEFLPTYNERQTEEEFIQPLFSILGFAYTPQVRFKHHEQMSVPDFALFISDLYFFANTAMRKNKSYEFLLAVNSTLMTYFHQQLVPEANRVFAEVKIVDLECLPIRRIYFTTLKDEREQQAAELTSFYKSIHYDSILTRIGELLPKDTDDNFFAFAHSISVKDAIVKGYMTKQDAEKSALKEDTLSGYDENGNPLEKSDIVHDFLAFLAEQMTEMNKSKRTQIGRFWTDLEGVTDADTFAKLQKGKQERSLARKEPLRLFVNPESASSKRLEYALEWTEEAFKEFVKLLVRRMPNLSDFLDVYHKYASAVQTLAQRVQATDELINQIVYRLYGLTEEEVKIVEESVKR